MFLSNKKGDMVLQFVILASIAVVMIILVTIFGAKIWSTFFPGGDKSTMKSFEATYNMINAKAISLKNYDSTNMNIYLANKYWILFFDEGKVECEKSHWYGTTKAKYLAPVECESSKGQQARQCLCIYKGKPEPQSPDADIEKNLVKCHPFQDQYYMNLDLQYLDINQPICDKDYLGGYGSYMFIRRVVDAKPYLYILELNDQNKKLDADWSAGYCNKQNDDPNGLCYNKKIGETLKPVNDASLSQIYAYCNAEKQVKSFSIECLYDQKEDKCNADCSKGTIASLCKQYSTCEDITTVSGLRGVNNMRYLSSDDDFATYNLCAKDSELCDVGKTAGTCGIQTIEIYPHKTTPSGGIKYMTLPTGITADVAKKCLTTYPGLIGGDEFVTKIDYTNPDCATLKDALYEKTKIVACRQNSTNECDTFVKDKKDSCDIKFVKDGAIYWLTYFKSDPTCSDDADKYFTTVQLCTTTKTP